MLYCFNAKHFKDNERTNKEIEYAISKKVFIYYDEESNVFKDENDNEVDVTNKEVFPVSFIFQLPALIKVIKRTFRSFNMFLKFTNTMIMIVIIIIIIVTTQLNISC